MKKLAKAMTSRGWSIPKCAQETGLGDQQIRNLVRYGANTRDTLPSQIKATTLVALLEHFPELDMDDFVPGTQLSVRT